MTQHIIVNEYFEWMCNIVRCDNAVSYRKLLSHLHNTDFRWIIPKDKNRYEDGVNLRYRFAIRNFEDEDDIEECLELLDGPCSVFEMMLALAIRCEETIMADPQFGDRTAQWFWCMVSSLGLNSMTDNRYKPKLVKDIIECFLDREYEPNGDGGLFTIKNCKFDMRTVEIWIQMCWYLDSIS